MLTYLPGYYQSSRVMRAIVQAQGAEIDKLRQAMDETLDQFFVNTATWSLGDWESELGLPEAPAQPDSERRARIISRIRGTGTCTIKLVKEVAESYDNGTVDAIQDHEGYTVIIQFIDTRGVPPNLDDMKAALRAVVPAHLEIQYEFRYLVWDDLDAQVLTEDQRDAMNLTWDIYETGSWLNA